MQSFAQSAGRARYANAEHKASATATFVPLFHAWALVVAIAAVIGLLPTPAAQDYGLEGEARYALNRLTATVPAASMLQQRAYATLGLPDITKAGTRPVVSTATAFCSGVEGLRIQIFRGVLRFSGRRADVRLCALLHERVGVAGPELD